MQIRLRLLSMILLSFFVFTTVGEARNTSVSSNSTYITKQQVKTTRHQKRTRPSVISRKKQLLTLSAKRQQQIGKSKFLR